MTTPTAPARPVPDAPHRATEFVAFSGGVDSTALALLMHLETK